MAGMARDPMVWMQQLPDGSVAVVGLVVFFAVLALLIRYAPGVLLAVAAGVVLVWWTLIDLGLADLL